MEPDRENAILSFPYQLISKCLMEELEDSCNCYLASGSVLNVQFKNSLKTFKSYYKISVRDRYNKGHWISTGVEEIMKIIE